MKRYIYDLVKSDLKNKMVFLGGPRQVGKTTLAVSFLSSAGKQDPGYFNWDSKAHRLALMRDKLPTTQPLLVLDEIHKYRRWRNLIKGLYDTNYPKVNYLVTGSARLDLYRFGGDSLHGRYFYHCLHPLSLNEISTSASQQDLNQLLLLGGFPEPFLNGSETYARRWRRGRTERIFQEDIRDLEKVQELGLLELLFDTLPDRMSSPISCAAIAKDLEVAPTTVARWLDIFERMYLSFRISPYGGPKIRAVKKEQKLYFWDWAHVQKIGVRLENMLASQLLKYCHYVEERDGHKMELRYLRDVHGREVDFVVLKDRQPLFAVECKSGDDTPSQSCAYFRERTKIPKFYQVHLGPADFGDQDKGTRVLPLLTFCKELELP